jgi:hypothetical protein
MRKGWVFATAVLSGVAGVSQAAEVQLFGIHSPSVVGTPAGTGRWAVYARVSNTASVEGGQVSGLSSIGADIINNTTPAGSATVLTAVNGLPTGKTRFYDNIFDPNPTPPPNPPANVDYGFWLVRSDGTPFNSGGESGIQGVSAGQNAFYVANPNVPYASLVLQNVGMAKGTVAADGDKTTSTRWSHPVLVATGTYTPSATTGAASQVGLKIRYYGDSGVNLLKATGDANRPWKLEGAAASTVVNAKTFTGVAPGAGEPSDTTVRAAPGDATLDGAVDFNDLVRLAQNYETSNNTWFEGDFNYDGTTDFNDLVILAQRYELPVPSAPVGASAEFGADMAAAFAAVPEPGSAMLVAAAAGMLGLRRRRC